MSQPSSILADTWMPCRAPPLRHPPVPATQWLLNCLGLVLWWRFPPIECQRHFLVHDLSSSHNVASEVRVTPLTFNDDETDNIYVELSRKRRKRINGVSCRWFVSQNDDFSPSPFRCQRSFLLPIKLFHRSEVTKVWPPAGSRRFPCPWGNKAVQHHGWALPATRIFFFFFFAT